MEVTATAQKGSLGQISWQQKASQLLASSLRNDAFQTLENQLFPSTKNEFWKYTRLGKVRQLELQVSTEKNITTLTALEEDAVLLVFENGSFRRDLSSTQFPDGMKVLAFSQMDEEEREVIARAKVEENDLFEAFNTHYLTDGLYIHVSAKMNIQPLVEIRHINSTPSSLSHFRLHLVLEAFSSLNVLERTENTSNATTFHNTVKSIQVAKNALLNYYTIQQANGNSFEMNNTSIDQEADSTIQHHTVSLAGQFIRNNVFVRVNGKGAQSNLFGSYLPKGKAHIDNHTIIDHRVAHCESNELYKGILDDEATAVFNGKVFVRKDAQKINAFQSNANVLLSDRAQMNSKPELEIYADDVKCSHGSTTGQIDDEAIFYLRARGINERKAKELMNHAFIGEVFEKIENESVLNLVYTLLSELHEWDADHLIED